MNYIVYCLMFFVTLSGFGLYAVNATEPTHYIVVTTPDESTESNSNYCTDQSCRKPLAKVGSVTKKIVTAPVRVTKRVIQNKPVRSAVIGTRLPTCVNCDCGCNQ